MYTELIVNVTDHETRVALLEDSIIVELFIEREEDDSNISGNIYKGKVQRVLPGMQAAFIDIGLKQAAFLYVNDLYESRSQDIEKIFSNNDDLNNDIDNNYSLKSNNHINKRIEDMIKEGQELIVQVAKAPIGTKGPRVTSQISLPGRFLVLMPSVDHIGISRRIENEEERKRLKKMLLDLKALKNDQYGYIFRTASEGIDEEALEAEMTLLTKLWNNILKKSYNVSATTLLHSDLAVALRAVRDLLTHDTDKVIVDSKKVYNSIISCFDNMIPERKLAIEFYEGHDPLFEVYNLEAAIDRALKKKVWLKSGGYIVIEHTEALVAIDVNTGRYVGKHDFEETVLKTNLEAVDAIAYQIRLRNIGGIIIIDFIDMENPEDQQRVFDALREAMKRDKSKTNILPLSDMGLVQMTRKRVRKSLNKMLCEPCHYCKGNGYILSKQSVCYNIYRDIIKKSIDITGVKLVVKAHPEIVYALADKGRNMISSLEKEIQRPIIVLPNHEFHIEEFEIYESLIE